MNKRLFLLIPLALTVFLFVPSVPTAHATTTGLVCMTAAMATGCPASPPAFGPFVVGTKFRIGIFIQNSDPMGGFDIYVKSDPGVTPTSADLGPLIVNPSLTSTCINGIAQNGACTVNTANGQGVVEVTTIEGSGSNECGGIGPCSGMAFFINYTVVAPAASSALSYPAAQGCSASSVSSPPDICVAVADNTGTFLSENIQAATVIHTSSPDFTMAATPSSLLVSAGISSFSNITLTSVNGLSGLVIFQTTPPPACLLCPTWNVNPATVQLSPGGTNSITLTFFTNSSTPAGRWIVNVTGTLGTISHLVTVVFTIISSGPPPDFTISANPSSLSLPAGFNASSTITLTSVNGFSGPVFLSTTPPPCSLPQCSVWFVTPTQIVLASGGTASASFVIVTGSRSESDSISVTGTSGNLMHQTNVMLQVQAASSDFFVNAFPSIFSTPAGTTASSQIQVTPTGFTSNTFSVTLSAQVQPPNGPTATLNPTMVTLSSFTAFSTLTITTLATTSPGNYTVTVTGSSTAFTHSVTINVQVLPPPTLKLTPTSGTVGTKVLVQGSGFPVQYGPSEIIVSFDDQLVGFIFTPTTSFNFTFNVPEAQAGPHTVKAFEPSFFNGSGTIMATAPFQVISSPSPTGFTVTLDIGTLYFPGDKATAFILVAQNGQPASPMDLQLTVQLIKPDGTTQILTTTKITTGLYSAVYMIPTTGTILGTYAITVKAHSSSLGDSAALGSFEAKPTWLSKNGGTIATGTAIAGVVGFGAVGLAWKKGYLKKKDDEQSLSF